MNEEMPFDENTLKPWGMKVSTFCMLLHLSQLTSAVLPGLGLILPIVMWATNKDDSQLIDQHGKNVLNWILSSIIYMAISALLVLVVIGIGGLIIIAVLSIIFPIMGALKADRGQPWKYPLTIPFLKNKGKV